MAKILIKNQHLLISMIHYVLSARTRVIITNKKPLEKPFEHYRNLLTIVSTLEEASLTRIALLTNRYLYKTGIADHYYTNEEISYINVHYRLVKTLSEEASILKIQGVESLLSRILFLLASTNRHMLDTKLLLEYAKKINTILSIPTPPWTDEARRIDLLEPGSKIHVFPGTILSTWILSTLFELLEKQEIETNIILCDEPYEDYLTINRLSRFHEFRDKTMSTINCRNILQYIKSIEPKSDLIISYNNILVYDILDHFFLGKNIPDLDKVLILINPIGTPLEEVLGTTPRVLMPSSMVNLIE